MIDAYRLCERRHALSGRAFRGEGARLAGGRWNPPGTAVVYAASSLSLASLEFLAHFESAEDVPELVCFHLSFDERLVTAVEKPSADWRQIPAPTSTQELGAEWLNGGRSAVLRVPSAIIPTEYNFVLNPAHPDFKQIKIGPAEPFSLDPRLLSLRSGKGLGTDY